MENAETLEARLSTAIEAIKTVGERLGAIEDKLGIATKSVPFVTDTPPYIMDLNQNPDEDEVDTFAIVNAGFIIQYLNGADEIGDDGEHMVSHDEFDIVSCRDEIRRLAEHLDDNAENIDEDHIVYFRCVADMVDIYRTYTKLRTDLVLVPFVELEDFRDLWETLLDTASKELAFIDHGERKEEVTEDITARLFFPVRVMQKLSEIKSKDDRVSLASFENNALVDTLVKSSGQFLDQRIHSLVAVFWVGIKSRLEAAPDNFPRFALVSRVFWEVLTIANTCGYHLPDIDADLEFTQTVFHIFDGLSARNTNLVYSGTVQNTVMELLGQFMKQAKSDVENSLKSGEWKTIKVIADTLFTNAHPEEA